jgi:hypothetical protein
MNEVIDSFHRLIPSRAKKTGRGWITFDCPACGDRRGRGGFLETPSGGFRYRCQNGGCRYEQKTGWEPTNGFMGRPRRLFEIMGGSIADIPQELIDGPDAHKKKKFDLTEPEQRRAWIAELMADWPDEAHVNKYLKERPAEVVLDFPEMKLPTGSIALRDATTVDGLNVQHYVNERCKYFKHKAAFAWATNRYKRYVIIPFFDRENKIIGWIARKIDDGKEFAHIKCPKFPTHYMLNQHHRYKYDIVLVVEGAFDALALDALCTFGNVISDKQANLLNQLKAAGKKIVLLPDFKKDEWRSYWNAAKRNGWYIAAPVYPGDDGYSPADYIKDPGDSIKRNGVIYTLDAIMKSITDNYDMAAAFIEGRSDRSVRGIHFD